MKNKFTKYGFSLVELIAIVSILGMIMIIAVPKVTSRIKANKKNTFIINARNIIRQIEYDNIELNTFTKTPLRDLQLSEFMSDNLDADNSYAYIVDDKIFLDLSGVNEYSDFYLCNVSNDKKKVEVQETPCDNDHNLIYIDFEVDLDGGTPSQEFKSKYLAGNYLILQIPTKDDTTFLGWQVVEGNSEIVQNRIKFGTENTKIKALWGTNPALVVDPKGGIITQEFESNYKGGTVITLEEPTRSGYTFKGWDIVEGNSILSGNVLTMGTLNTRVEAIWELNEYTITYNLNGGNVTPGSPTTYTIETNDIVLNNPTKDGYNFIGWYENSNLSGSKITKIPKGSTGNKTFYASWDATNVAYKVEHYQQNANDSNYTLKDTDNLTGLTGSSVTPTAKTYTGFKTPATQTVTIKADGTTVVKYYYDRNTYVVTLNKGLGISSVTGAGTYKYGQTVTISATVSSGYSWSNWTGDLSSSTQSTSFTMQNKAMAITANATVNAIESSLIEDFNDSTLNNLFTFNSSGFVIQNNQYQGTVCNDTLTITFNSPSAGTVSFDYGTTNNSGFNWGMTATINEIQFLSVSEWADGYGEPGDAKSGTASYAGVVEGENTLVIKITGYSMYNIVPFIDNLKITFN